MDTSRNGTAPKAEAARDLARRCEHRWVLHDSSRKCWRTNGAEAPWDATDLANQRHSAGANRGSNVPIVTTVMPLVAAVVAVMVEQPQSTAPTTPADSAACCTFGVR